MNPLKASVRPVRARGRETVPPLVREVSDQFEAFARSLPQLLEPILKASEGRVAAAAANAILQEMRALKLAQLANEAATNALTAVVEIEKRAAIQLSAVVADEKKTSGEYRLSNNAAVESEKRTSGEYRLDLDGKMLAFEARLSQLERPTIPAPEPEIE